MLTAFSPFYLNSNNWSPSEAGYGAGPPGWYKEAGLVDPDVVHLQGAVQQTSTVSTGGVNPNLIGTLPPAACPDRVVYAIVHTFNGTYADLAINPDGQITLINPRPPAVQDYRFVSLECIIYEQFLPVPNLIELNKNNWSPNTEFGSSAPAWYLDGSSYVHLQGAATQTNPNPVPGSNPNLLGTILGPPAPNVFVYTIVHTQDGTYADVSINPGTGDIALINPRPPAVQDYSFVSLEGIIYSSIGVPPGPISLNIANWTGEAGYSSVAPAWNTDALGIVHLYGAAKQANPNPVPGSNPNLLGTLPAAASPTRSVYTIAHTFNGTFADLVINPDGTIVMIGARNPPFIQDYSFVSLDHITYLP
jgi:hypothetical protein